MGKKSKAEVGPLVLEQPDKDTLSKYEGRLCTFALDDGEQVSGKIYSCGEHAVILHVAAPDTKVITPRGVFYQNIDTATEKPVG